MKILIDRGFSGDPYKTKSTTMQKYKNVYSGPEMEIHFKYSTALNLIFVTMMYGIAMPIMWPLCAVAILSQRITEKIQVAWLVQLPPAMDDQITRHVMSLLKYAPLFLLCNGYWLLDNR